MFKIFMMENESKVATMLAEGYCQGLTVIRITKKFCES